MAKGVSRTVYFPRGCFDRVEAYAKERGLGFSAAVAELCDRSSYGHADRSYMPHFSQALEDAGDDVVRRVGGEAALVADEAADRVILWLEERFGGLGEEVDL